MKDRKTYRKIDNSFAIGDLKEFKGTFWRHHTGKTKHDLSFKDSHQKLIQTKVELDPV